eukprot:14169574-Alexandrium_andersonii.AAC.1
MCTAAWRSCLSCRQGQARIAHAWPPFSRAARARATRSVTLAPRARSKGDTPHLPCKSQPARALPASEAAWPWPR